jgi:hypothetical protein
MDSNIFINNFIENLNNIRNFEASINNNILIELEIEKKELGNDLMEFRNYKSDMIKKTLKNKTKLGDFKNINENQNEINNINILEDDIFNNNEEENKEEFKLDFINLTKEDKEKLIFEYIKRKNIYLDEIGYKKIEDILNDNEFPFKKYLTISKVYQQITKIQFFKRQENGNYIVDTSEKKIKNKNLFFK